MSVPIRTDIEVHVKEMELVRERRSKFFRGTILEVKGVAQAMPENEDPFEFAFTYEGPVDEHESKLREFLREEAGYVYASRIRDRYRRRPTTLGALVSTFAGTKPPLAPPAKVING